MSSAAHWLVLGAAASREKGGFICMGNGAVNTHASCGHAARSGSFKGLKSSPPSVLQSWSFAAVHQLATISPPPLSRFHASSFLLLSQCHPSYVGGGAAAILDSLKMETGEKKKFSSPSPVPCHLLSLFKRAFFYFFLRGLNAVREQNKA